MPMLKLKGLRERRPFAWERLELLGCGFGGVCCGCFAGI
jgi:hypothetical protein